MSSCNDIVDRGKGQNTCFGSDDNSAALEEKNGCEIADRGAGISYAEGKNKKSSKHVVRCVPTDKLVKLGALTGINLKHTGIPPGTSTTFPELNGKDACIVILLFR